MEKRLLIAFVLSLLVLLVSQSLLQKRIKPPEKTNAPLAAPSERAALTQSPLGGTSGSPEKSAKVPAVVATATHVSSNLKAQNKQEIVLENNLVKITLSNRGAVIKGWTLKKYKDSEKDSDRKVLDLVAGVTLPQAELPLRLVFPSDPALTSQVDSALFLESKETKEQTAEASGSKALLRYSENGVFVEKELRLQPDSYLVRLTLRARKGNLEQPFLVTWPAHFGDNALDVQSDARDVVTISDRKIDKTSLVKVKETKELTEGYRIAGVVDHYFAAIFLPADGISRLQIMQSGVALALSSQPISLFVGPKEIQILKHVDPQLESLVDFGWFTIIAKPLFLGLKWIYGFCNNYGLAIIILTVIINTALFPLRWKSMVSAQKMQKLQPRIKAIQEKYKKYKASDPKKQEMNQEMMALYKGHGVNPLGGCLPLLLQMPILIAFYNVLSVAIDLRQVSFLWIPDLSQYDKTFVLVIVMVITQFLMQKLTPSPSTDPAQAKMFMLMPLIFGFMFAKVASGLVLYWLTGNVIGIIQQLFLNKYGMATTPATSNKDKVPKG